MNVDEISRYVNMLVGGLTFTADYNSLVKGTKRLLIVEGQTDKKFIERILKDDVVCVVANKAFGAQKGFGREAINCKSAIMQVVYGMSKLPITFLKVPKSFETCTIFGMIDLDYDDPSGEYLSTSRLFVTDTHDLETLLMSTDDGILQKLNDCVISPDDSKKAFYLAYQLGVIRKAIYENNNTEMVLTPVSGGGPDEVDYSYFVSGYEINIRKLISYINERCDYCLSSAKEKKLADKVVKDKQLKKKLDSDDKWNGSWEEFEASKVADFWEVVNGHDILSLLRYINRDAAEKYANHGSFSLNRDFEMDLVDSYEYAALGETKIYKDMRTEQVVTDI